MQQEKVLNGECKPKQNKSIVVTGYGPFGDHKVNASWEAVKSLKELWNNENNEVKLITEEIPVCYDFVQQQVPNKWRSDDKNCDVIAMLHVGVSSIAKRITLEEVANSDGYNKYDVDGKCPANGRCLLDKSCNGESDEDNICISSAFNVDKLVEELNKSMGDGSAEKSRDAGRYLCEFVYFKSLYTMNRRALFIHVPTLDISPAEKCAQAIKHIIDHIILNY